MPGLPQSHSRSGGEDGSILQADTAGMQCLPRDDVTLNRLSSQEIPEMPNALERESLSLRATGIDLIGPKLSPSTVVFHQFHS